MAAVVVLRHAKIEGPGLLGYILKERGIAYHIIDTAAQTIPKADILIPMGGPMSVNDSCPWLQREMDFIERHIEWGGYAFGTCLGAQLIAKAIGGQVTDAGLREVGNYVEELTGQGMADVVFGGLEAKLPVFQWHGETFGRLPQSAIVLATGNRLNQAFRYGNAYGVQFHWEATEGMVKKWIAADPDYLKGVPTTSDNVLRQFGENSRGYQSSLLTVFGRFLDIALSS